MSSNIAQIIRLIASTSFHQFTGLSFSRLTLVTQLSMVPAMTRMYPYVIIVYAEISRANYNRTSARKFHSFFSSPPSILVISFLYRAPAFSRPPRFSSSRLLNQDIPSACC